MSQRVEALVEVVDNGLDRTVTELGGDRLIDRGNLEDVQRFRFRVIKQTALLPLGMKRSLA